MSISLSRRNLLIRSAAVAAGAQAVGVSRLFAADAAEPKPGVQMYMVAADFKKDPAGTLKQLAAMGYGYVEAFAMAISNVGEFKKMLGDAGLGKYVISSVLPPGPPKEGGAAGIMAKMNQLTADDFKSMAAAANQIAESAKRHGLVFAYHNHNVEFRKFEGGQTGYDILLKETDPALVKLEVDAGWVAAGGGDPAALIAANADRVKLMHFKDFSTVTPPINELGPAAGGHIVDLGTGVAPLKAAYAAAKKAGVEYFIVDHDPPFKGKTALEAAKLDYAYVAGLMKA
jgi:sugar phosphate isomerase/epimerase